MVDGDEDDRFRIARRDLLRTGALAGGIAGFGVGARPVAAGGVSTGEEGYAFFDDFEDGDYTADPAWEVYLSQGNYDASVIDLSGPDGGSKALDVTEETGGGTDGVIGWAEPTSGWDGPWRLEGLFYTRRVNTSIDFQYHSVGAYYSGSGDSPPVEAVLGFTDSSANVIPFRIGGSLVDTVEETYDPGWSEGTWYRYELAHDGEGTYTGRLWEDGTGRPSEPNARSVGDPPGTEERVGAVRINGAPDYYESDAFNMSHAFVGWTRETRVRGYFGRYYNHSADHPDFAIEDEFDGVNLGLVESTLPLRLTPKGKAYYDRFDWYDREYLTASRVDDALDFGSNFFPDVVDEGEPGDPRGFAVHWTATAVAPEAGTYELTATSDDDCWVFLDGDLAIDLGGHHRDRTRSTTVDLATGEYPLDLFFAERLSGSTLSFAPDDRLDVFVRRPEGVTDCEDKSADVAPSGTVSLANDGVELAVGPRGSRSWTTGGTETLFEELFVLADGDGNTLASTEMSVVDGFSPVGVVGDGDRDYPGIEYGVSLEGTLGGERVFVNRSVLLDPCRAALDIEYGVELGSGADRIDGVRLYQYADHDVGGCDGDVGTYDAAADLTLVEPADGDGPAVGFGAVDSPDGDDPASAAHHVGEAPARDAVRSGSLNGASSFPADGGGDPAVAQAWDLGPLTPPGAPVPGERREAGVTVRFGVADSPADLAALLAEPVRTLEDATELADVSLPPTAVETDQPVEFEARLETCADPALFGGRIDADVTRRGAVTGFQSVDLEGTPDGSDTVVLAGELDPATAFADRPKGVGYTATIEVWAGPEDNALLELGTAPSDPDYVRTYAFRAVDRVAAVAAHPSDVRPSPTGRDLFELIRNRAEFINERYASGLGNMGAKGFDVEVLSERGDATDPLVAAWTELSGVLADYETDKDPGLAPQFSLPDDNVRSFVKEALGEFDPGDSVDVRDYDTGLVVNLNGLSRPNWQGSIPPVYSFAIPEIDFDWRSPTSVPLIDIRPYDLDGGEQIDAIYATLRDDSWSHEFGHATGPGLQVGFPEMYAMDGLANFGNIGNWGVMGQGAYNDVVSSFVRGIVGDQYDELNSWIGWDTTLHVLDDASLSLDTPLHEFELGASGTLLLSAYLEFAVDIEVEYPSLDDPNPVDVTVEETAPRFGIYVLENREGEVTGIEDPANDALVTAPPTSDGGSDYQTGVAIYRLDILEIEEFDVDLTDILDSDVRVDIDESIQLDYLPADQTADPADRSARPTAISLSTDHTTYEDRGTATTFELTEPRSARSGPDVTAKRDVEDLIDVDGGPIEDAITFVVDLLEAFEDRLREAYDAATSGSERRPKFDVVAETPDGRRAGTDPETGETVEEIEGARVTQTMTRTLVSVPADAEATFRVSDARLREFLADRGVEVPEPVAYDRTVVLDSDPEVVERDGYAYVEGRTVQRGPAAVGEGDRPALQSVPVDVEPPVVNAKSGGNFLTAFVGIGDADPADLALESVALEQVPAVTDEQYGFVRNPPARTRDGEIQVMVKFPRDRVIEQLGTGDHEVGITGLAGGVTVYGRTGLIVIDPGKGEGGDGQKGDDTGGSGKPGDGKGGGKGDGGKGGP